MKKAVIVLFSLVLLITVGCQTAKITISAEPDDAKIYVNGEYVGDGVVSYDTKQGRWGYSKELSVIIKHPDFTTLYTTIKNEFDTVYAVATGAVCFGLGGVFTILGINEANPTTQAIDYGTAAADGGAGVIGVMGSYKFNSSFTSS